MTLTTRRLSWTERWRVFLRQIQRSGRKWLSMKWNWRSVYVIFRAQFLCSSVCLGLAVESISSIFLSWVEWSFIAWSISTQRSKERFARSLNQSKLHRKPFSNTGRFRWLNSFWSGFELNSRSNGKKPSRSLHESIPKALRWFMWTAWLQWISPASRTWFSIMCWSRWRHRWPNWRSLNKIRIWDSNTTITTWSSCWWLENATMKSCTIIREHWSRNKCKMET